MSNIELIVKLKNWAYIYEQTGTGNSQICNLVRESATVLEAMEWQPMSTAPTDRDILVFVGKTKEMFVVFHGTQMDTGKTDWVFGRFKNGDCAILKNPTYWMDLPKKPKDES